MAPRLQSVEPFTQVRAEVDQLSQDVRRANLTAKQAVVYLNLGSLSALYYHIRENRLPYGRVGNRYRFDPRRLDAWVSSSGAGLLLRKGA